MLRVSPGSTVLPHSLRSQYAAHKGVSNTHFFPGFLKSVVNDFSAEDRSGGGGGGGGGGGPINGRNSNFTGVISLATTGPHIGQY